MTEQEAAPRQLTIGQQQHLANLEEHRKRRRQVKRAKKREQAQQAKQEARARIEALILIADRAKNQRMYWVANKIFRYLIKQYFAILTNERLIFIESHQTEGTSLPPGMRAKIGLVKSSNCTFKLRSVGKICDLPPDMQQAWRTLLTSFDGPDLAVLKSPISEATICIPTPRLQPNIRALMYAFGKRVPRHVSTRVPKIDPNEQLRIGQDLASMRIRLPW